MNQGPSSPLRAACWTMASLLLCLLPATSQAATWMLGNASGPPGATVNVPLHLKGDGATTGADIAFGFSNTRLFIDQPVGVLSGGAAGVCSWNGADRVSGIVFNADTAPLPPGNTLVCTFKFRILPTAPTGTTMLTAHATHCADADASPEPCTLQGGAITVLGPAPPKPPAALPDSTALFIQLAPSLTEPTPPHWGLDTLRDVPPVHTRWLRRDRAIGERALRHRANPDSTDALLERVVVAEFANADDRDVVRKLLESDPAVLGTSVGENQTLHSGAIGVPTPAASKTIGGVEAQPHLAQLNLPAAWNRARGWGLVGVADNGIDPDHSELRSFTGSGSIGGSFVPGGNYLPFLSANIAGHSQPVDNLRETQGQPLSPGNIDNDAVCDGPDGKLDGLLSYQYAGHGSHVAGLIGANGSTSAGVRGTCVNCGLAMRKMAYLNCAYNYLPIKPESVGSIVSPTNPPVAFEEFARLGAQVVNYSGGAPHLCSGQYDSYCNAILFMAELDVVLVAASGNHLTDVQFPARHIDAVSVGGIDNSGAYWDQRPNGCPYENSIKECGSNYNKTPAYLTYKQELVATSKDVWSSLPVGKTWNPDIACGDSQGAFGTPSDGFGPCTGTSMSAPQVAGIFGLVRSVNPLMPAGNPFHPTNNPYNRTTPAPNPFGRDAYGVRDVVVQTADRAQAGSGNDPKLGFGIPDADAAIRKVLGTVRGEQMQNRLTPLFSLYSPGATDYAAVATPQMAMSLAYFHTSQFRSVLQPGDSFVPGASIPGYPSFPNVYYDNEPAKQPRASALVLTTHVSPVPSSPPVVPLYLMERRAGNGAPDFILLSSNTAVQSAASAGYRYLGQQGYVYSYCAPSPTCKVPAGAQALHLKCNNMPGVQDCAVFLDSQAAQFTAKGYTSLFPGTTGSQLGYAYPIADKDNDGLVDAVEGLIGTSTAHPDSDGDGKSDGAEYPLATAPVSDPCQGPSVVCPRPPWYVYEDQFESP